MNKNSIVKVKVVIDGKEYDGVMVEYNTSSVVLIDKVLSNEEIKKIGMGEYEIIERLE